MGGHNDPHLEAMMETEARYPRQAPPEPESFRRRQFWVALGIAAALSVAWFATAWLR